MSQATPSSIPLLNSRYRIAEKLGVGRLAVVYRAHDERLQRPVLLHMLRKELMDQAALRQRFVDEGHASARRSHRSLLEVYDSGDLAGRPYIITEYVAGRTLRELGALTLEDALLYFRQVVGAVAACQAAGVSHPPISSNNLILVSDGHVELVESWLIPPAEVALDLASYRPPERASGQGQSPAGTVYSLGLLLFEMLTGKRAISGDDPRQVAQAHLTASIPSLASIRPSIYMPTLDQLLQQATARDPAQRTPNAATLAQAIDELRRAVGGETRPLGRPSARRAAPAAGPKNAAPAQPAPTAPATPAPPTASENPAAGPSTRGRSLLRQGRGRSLGWLAVTAVLFLVVACGAYYGATLAADRLFNLKLPRIDALLPNLPLPELALPEWLTGVVDGGGEVLVVSGVPDGGLRLRDAPKLDSGVIEVLPNGTRVRKLEGPVEADTIPWLRVRTRLGDRSLEGWVSGNFVKSEAGGAPSE